MIEPVSETEPMIAPSRVAIMNGSDSSSPGCSPASRRNSARATTAAAPPPAPLKMATICGMAVIGTRRAPSTPITEPTRPPTARIHQLASIPSTVKKVHRMISAMPAAPSWLPRRAVAGEARNLSARMKVTEPTSQTR